MSKIYFASDFHLGLDARLTSEEREKQIVRWLDQIAGDAEAIYLVGDMFDFWFEYRSVVPRGFHRFIGKLAELRDGGLPIYFFTGNHDMWMFSFFEKELGIPVYRHPIRRTLKGKQFLIGHGDGLGPGDYGYKRLKKIFTNPWCQWLFARLHPNFAFGMAQYWSRKSRLSAGEKDRPRARQEEWLVQYAERKLAQEHIDYFVFGHRHLPISCLLSNGVSWYYNLGDWLYFNSYAILDEDGFRLRFFEHDAVQVYEL